MEDNVRDDDIFVVFDGKKLLLLRSTKDDTNNVGSRLM